MSNTSQPSSDPVGALDVIPVTVVMRSYNDAALLPRTLAALDSQTGVEVRLHVYESASKDESVELLEEHGYDYIKHLEPGSYRSSRVLNWGVARAETEVVVFLNSDAIIERRDTLRLLSETLLSDESLAGVFACQTTRPDAGFGTRLEYAKAFGRRHEMNGQADWMSLVCSAIRKSVWERCPFDEKLTYAEDAVWTQHVQNLGYRTRYVPEALVEHSHDYTWAERYKRSFNDAAALASIADEAPHENMVGGFLLPYFRRCAGWGKDLIVRDFKPWRLPSVCAHLYPLMLGQWRGSLAGWEHFHVTRADGDQPLV